MPHIQLNIGNQHFQFEASTGASILDEAIQAGAPINYSCKRGDCGQCAGKLEHGQVTTINPAYPDHAGDDILLCNTSASSDLCLQMPHFPELDGIRVLRTPAKIHSLNRLSTEIMEATLRLPPSQAFQFLPGQFIRLTNKAKITRSYSLADCPREDNLLRLHIRRVDGGAFSQYLFEQAKEGDLLHMEGPQGHFFVREADQANKSIFLATGTGIAPVLAILLGLNDDQRAALGHISVYWGNRARAEEYLTEELRLLSQRLSFDYWPVFSREADADTRHVQDLMATHHEELSDALVFACGNTSMIESARKLCATMGLPSGRFRCDPFTPS